MMTGSHTIIGGVITREPGELIFRAAGPRKNLIHPSRRSLRTLPSGNYTAIVRGVNDTTGVDLVEVYDLQ